MNKVTGLRKIKKNLHMVAVDLDFPSLPVQLESSFEEGRQVMLEHLKGLLPQLGDPDHHVLLLHPPHGRHHRPLRVEVVAPTLLPTELAHLALMTNLQKDERYLPVVQDIYLLPTVPCPLQPLALRVSFKHTRGEVPSKEGRIGPRFVGELKPSFHNIGSRSSVVKVRDDPFHRMPDHVDVEEGGQSMLLSIQVIVVPVPNGCHLTFADQLSEILIHHKVVGEVLN